MSAVIKVVTRFIGTSAIFAISADFFGPSASSVKTSMCRPANKAFDAINPNAMLETSSAVSAKPLHITR